MLSPWRGFATLALTFAVLGCETQPSGIQNPGEVQAGRWGGDAIELTVMANGATLRLCCATGTVDQALVLDASGHFEATGTYTFESGPIPVDGFHPIPAQYSGTVDSSSMTLRIATASEILGPFMLTFGRSGILQNCICPV